MRPVLCVLSLLLFQSWGSLVAGLRISPELAGGSVQNTALTRDVIDDINQSRKVLPSSSHEKVHLKSKGHPLRQYSQTPQSNRLDAGTKQVQALKRILWCNLGLQSKERIEQCQFQSLDGTMYLVINDTLSFKKNSGLWSEPREKIYRHTYNIQIHTKDDKNCMITVEGTAFYEEWTRLKFGATKLEPNFFGKWNNLPFLFLY